MAAGLSPTQSALLGARAGSATYQNALGQGYGTAVSQQLGQEGYGIQTQQMNNNLWGTLLSAGSALLPLLFARGSDSVTALTGEHGPEKMIEPNGSLTIIGQAGPEVRQIKQGSMIIPTLKDGYQMLDYSLKAAKDEKPNETPSGVSIGKDNKVAASLSMIDALNDKIERIMKHFGGSHA